jgi:kinesin family protein C1
MKGTSISLGFRRWLRRRLLAHAPIHHDCRTNRVQKARDSGQLLVFSPTFRNPAPLPPDPIESSETKESTSSSVESTAGGKFGMTSDHSEASNEMEEESEDLTTPSNMEVDVADGGEKSQFSFVTTQTNTQNSVHITNELRSLRETVNKLVESKESSGITCQQEGEKLNTEAHMIRIETLALANVKLEEKNERLEGTVKEMDSKASAEYSGFLAKTARLEAELGAVRQDTDSRVLGLEDAKHNLETQLSKLQDERLALSNQVSKLESNIEDTRGHLSDSKLMLQALKEESSKERATVAREGESVEKTNMELSRELEQLREKNESLNETIKEYEEKIDALENDLLPESENQLQAALERLKRHEEADEEVQSLISEYEEAIENIKNELDTVRQEKEEERANFQALNEDSSEAYEQTTKDLSEKNIFIAQLQEKLKSTEERLLLESREVDEVSQAMHSLQSLMDQRVEDLEKSLSDSLSQLKQSSSDKEALEQKLADVMDQLQKDSEFKEEVLTRSNETSAAMREMDEQSKFLQQRLHELEKQLATTKADRDDAQSRMETFNEREENIFVRLRESDRVRRGLHNRVMQLSGNIRVYVRVRPSLPGEAEAAKNGAKPPQGAGGKKRKHSDVEEDLFCYPGMGGSSSKKSALGADDPTKNILEVTEPKKDRGGLSERRKKWTFGFDHVFNPSHGQEDIWEATEPLVQSAIDGYNVTIFAYGQTGSGKTYTMLGESGNEGVISRAVTQLFDAKREIEELSRGESSVELSVELLEIYNEKVRDLLVPNSGPEGQEISLKVTANEAVGSVILPTANEDEVAQIMEKAQKRRRVKATTSNAVSSRSHMLFTIHFKVSSKNGMGRAGKLHVCDLAGSERLGKSNANEHVGVSIFDSFPTFCCCCPETR